MRFRLACCSAALAVLATACGVEVIPYTGPPATAAREEKPIAAVVAPDVGARAPADSRLVFSAEEFPGDWLLSDERIVPAEEFNAPPTCLPEFPTGALTAGWSGTFFFEHGADGSGTGSASITTARFVDPAARAATLARVAAPGFADCVTQFRADRADEPGAGPGSTAPTALPGGEGARYRTSLPRSGGAAPQIVDSAFVVVGDWYVRVVVCLCGGEPSRMADRMLSTAIARASGAAPVALPPVAQPARKARADIKSKPGTQGAPVTRSDIESYANAHPTHDSGDCPLVPTAVVAAAVPGVWERWQPAFAGASTTIGAADDPTERYVGCTWVRTGDVDGTLTIWVISGDELAKSIAANLSKPLSVNGHRSGSTEWGPLRCWLYDAPDAAIMIRSKGSTLGNHEIWSLCDAVAPQVRAVIAAG